MAILANSIPQPPPSQCPESEASMGKSLGKKKLFAIVLILIVILAVSIASFLLLFSEKRIAVEGVQLQVFPANKQNSYTNEHDNNPEKTTYTANSANDTLLVVKARWSSATWNEELSTTIDGWNATVTDETGRVSTPGFLSVWNNGDIVWIFSVANTSKSFTLSLSNQTIKLSLS